jgi:hypothetical protein
MPRGFRGAERLVRSAEGLLRQGSHCGLDDDRRFQLAFRETPRLLKTSVNALKLLAVAIEQRDNPMVMLAAFILTKPCACPILGHEKSKLPESDHDGIALCERT